jgi:hypothetical protein
MGKVYAGASLFLLVSTVLCVACLAQGTAAKDGLPEAWQKEFSDVCSKTQDAMTFSVAELKGLIQRCDALVPQIEKLDETRKKVYLRQLQQCRGLFNYVLESKTKDSK